MNIQVSVVVVTDISSGSPDRRVYVRFAIYFIYFILLLHLYLISPAKSRNINQYKSKLQNSNWQNKIIWD